MKTQHEQFVEKVDKFLKEHGITFPFHEEWIYAKFKPNGDLIIQIDGSIKIKRA